MRRFYEHFYLPGHSELLKYLPVTLPDNIRFKNPAEDGYWIHSNETKTAMWLNVADALLAYDIVFCFWDLVYGRTVFRQWYPDMISKFLLLYCYNSCDYLAFSVLLSLIWYFVSAYSVFLSLLCIEMVFLVLIIICNFIRYSLFTKSIFYFAHTIFIIAVLL